MAKKELMYKGFLEEEVKKMSSQEFSKITNSRARRTIKKGFNIAEIALLKKIETGKNNVKTHARDMIVIPSMVGKTIKVHSGKEFIDVICDFEKLGHRLGEFVMTRKPVKHSAAGIGSTKSSKNATVGAK